MFLQFVVCVSLLSYRPIHHTIILLKNIVYSTKTPNKVRYFTLMSDKNARRVQYNIQLRRKKVITIFVVVVVFSSGHFLLPSNLWDYISDFMSCSFSHYCQFECASQDNNNNTHKKWIVVRWWSVCVCVQRVCINRVRMWMHFNSIHYKCAVKL